MKEQIAILYNCKLKHDSKIKNLDKRVQELESQLKAALDRNQMLEANRASKTLSNKEEE